MTAALAAYWRGMATGARTTIATRLLLCLLAPLALLYSLIQRLRAALYRTGLLTSRTLPRPVVSIGNITVGGTGKTPVTAWIARFLLRRGLKVAVLSRGYGGSREGTCATVSDGTNLFLTAEECGDEPYLLASTIAGLMVVIGADRHAAGCYALERLEPDVFLLDDGFQHIRLQRDLNILLLDCRRPFGNGWTIPAGLLREPRSALQRADLILHTRCSGETLPATLTPEPAAICRHELTDAIPVSGGDPAPLSELRGKRLLAFAGIAEPESFFSGLRALGLDVVKTISFADHTRYTDEHHAMVLAAQRESSAELILTTEKDGVKLCPLWRESVPAIFLVRMKLTFVDEAPLSAALLNLLQK